MSRQCRRITVRTMNTHERAQHAGGSGFDGAAGLRVAIVTETYPPEVNGVAMTIARLVGGLLERGCSVQLVRPRRALEDAAPTPPRYREVLAPGFPIPFYRDLRFGFTSARRLAALWREQRPDIVHVVTEGPLGWAAVRAARRLGLPVSSGFHTNFHAYCAHYRLGLFRRVVGAYLRMLHNRTLATLVPTRAIAAQLAADGYRNLALVSRGVDTALFGPARRSLLLRARWGVFDAAPVVLYVGRIAEEKNVGLVLRAFAAIERVRPDARLVIVGDGPLRDSLRQQCPVARLCGVKSGVELAEHYASADIFLFASLTETYGNVVAEALASGLAVLAYGEAAAAELVTDRLDGRLVEAGDERAFIAAACELATQDALRVRLAAAAPRAVAARGWAQVHDGFLALLAQLARGGAAAGCAALTDPAAVPAMPARPVPASPYPEFRPAGIPAERAG